MAVTEQEANTKICPHIRYCLNPYQVADGHAAIFEHLNCVASACMAWREDKNFGEPGKRPGFCGLAGQP